jgi:hypothetical protein
MHRSCQQSFDLILVQKDWAIIVALDGGIGKEEFWEDGFVGATTWCGLSIAMKNDRGSLVWINAVAFENTVQAPFTATTNDPWLDGLQAATS